MKKETGFDSKKRWGNSAMKGYGVNSPAMMKARKSFKERSLKKVGRGENYMYLSNKHLKRLREEKAADDYRHS